MVAEAANERTFPIARRSTATPEPLGAIAASIEWSWRAGPQEILVAAFARNSRSRQEARSNSMGMAGDDVATKE
jgi:hypothetical protein